MQKLTSFIQHHVPEAHLVEDIGTEVCYQLPEVYAHNGAFVKLFTDLDFNLSTLNISGYGISETTLEEVGSGL